MHEMSIAQAILERVIEHAPPDQTVLSVHVVAGPLRGIVPEAMQWAWEALRQESPFPKMELQLQIQPWELLCQDCGRRFATDRCDDSCVCNSTACYPVGGDELYVDGMEVEDCAGSLLQSRS